MNYTSAIRQFIYRSTTLRYVYVVYALIIFLLLFLGLFPFFLLLALFGAAGRRGVWYLIKAWSYIWLFLIGMPVHRIYGQKPDPKQACIVVANHISYLDTAMIFRVMPFMVRPLARHDFARIPLFGFLYRLYAVLVDRQSRKSKARSLRRLKQVLEQECSVFIFPEGSFNQTGRPLAPFYNGAFKLAIETGVPVLPLVFPDTNKRWHYRSFWAWSIGRSRAIFLPAIPTTGLKPSDAEALKQRCRLAMERLILKCG